MPIKILSDIVDVVSEHISNPGTSGFEIFVGLEHYDSGDPLITRYGSTNNLASSVKHFVSGDILVARRNVYLRRAGVVRFEGVTSGDSIVLRVKDKEYSDILPFILNSDDFWDYAEQNSDGTMSKRLAPDVLLEYECNIPDNHYQIANKLWAAYRLKESYKRLLAATDEMVKSQFIEMFYRGQYKNEKLKSHIEVIRGVSYKPTDVRDEVNDSSAVILRSNNIDNGEINLDDLVYVDKSRVSITQIILRGDIIMCGSNGSKSLVGKAAMIDNTPKHMISFGAFCLCIRCKETINPMYLSTFFQTSIYRDIIEELGSGSNILNIKPEHIYNIEIPIPSIIEQNKFISIAEQADKSKFELRKSIDAIDQVIKSLING